MDREQLGATIAKCVDQRRAAAAPDVILELGPRAVQIAGVIERGQPLQDFLMRRLKQLRNMRRAQEAMAGDLAHDLDIALRDLERGR